MSRQPRKCWRYIDRLTAFRLKDDSGWSNFKDDSSIATRVKSGYSHDCYNNKGSYDWNVQRNFTHRCSPFFPIEPVGTNGPFDRTLFTLYFAHDFQIWHFAKLVCTEQVVF